MSQIYEKLNDMEKQIYQLSLTLNELRESLKKESAPKDHSLNLTFNQLYKDFESIELETWRLTPTLRAFLIKTYEKKDKAEFKQLRHTKEDIVKLKYIKDESPNSLFSQKGLGKRSLNELLTRLLPYAK